MKDIQAVLKFLGEIGLNFYESKVFLSVIENVKQTVFEISKTTKISRTNVYRIVDKLQKIGLIEQIIVSNKKYLVPTGDEKLELLVKEQESKANLLRSTLPDIKSLFSTNARQLNPDFEYINYRGYDGIKDILFNLLQAKNNLYCYVVKDIAELLYQRDFALWFEEFLKKKFDIKELVTENYWLGIQAARSTKLDQIVRTETKKVPRNSLDIHFNQYVYNNTVAFITWNRDEIYGTEIVSEKLSFLEKQKFDILWRNL